MALRIVATYHIIINCDATSITETLADPSQHPLTLLPSPSSLILPNTKMLLNPSLNNGFSDWIHLLIHIYVDCLGS